MIDKKDFYHGAALIRIIEDGRYGQIAAEEVGYRIGGARFVLVKYSTKEASPWRFTFTNDELAAIESHAIDGDACSVAFVCGGDGVCAISWTALEPLLGATPSWTSCSRRFHSQYTVAGANGVLDRKVSIGDWPEVLSHREFSL
jgi:hypothetical protein